MEGIEAAQNSGVRNVILFGVVENKDEIGSGAWDENGSLQCAVREIKKQASSMQVVTDVCLCEYTSHGHCGVIENGDVNNDKTLDLLAKAALSHARAGADIVAPSDMMDARVHAIRTALDAEGFENKAILAYSAKYASAYYGPFRDVAGSAPSFGDRKTYQMDMHNRREAIKETLLDIDEGADMVMVKPALAYLDIISDIHKATNVPVCAYSVSGEYAMRKAAANAGVIDDYRVMCESATSIYRAGASMLITYDAIDLAKAIDKGDIG